MEAESGLSLSVELPSLHTLPCWQPPHPYWPCTLSHPRALEDSEDPHRCVAHARPPGYTLLHQILGQESSRPPSLTLRQALTFPVDAVPSLASGRKLAFLF